jgi:hypothetical protein
MATDSILEEIYAVREALAKAAGYDAEKIAETARRREQEGGRLVVTLSPRPVTTKRKKAS